MLMERTNKTEYPPKAAPLEKGAEFRIFDVKEIRVLHSALEVNIYLERGWTLFRVFTESSFIVVRF